MDHYKLLGVKDTASKEEISKAYRKLALKYHPDKNHAANAEDKMSALNEAYKVLQDERKRESYDRFDLPQTRKADRESQGSYQRQASHRNRYDDRFFMGSSESCSAEQRYKSTLDEIQRVNADLLDAVNAKRRRRQSAGHARRPMEGSNKFVGEIMADKTDDEYEKIVLERLRALGRH